MHGRRGQNETKRNNAFANRLTVLHPETSVKLDVEPNDTWDKRLRKRGRGEPVKKSRSTSKVPVKRGRKSKETVIVDKNKPIDIHDIPNEVLARVFSNLYFGDLITAEKVCRRFRDIATQIIWPHKSVIDAAAIEEGPLSNDIQTCGHPKRRKLTDNAVKMVLKRAEIRELDVSNYCCSITYRIANSFNLAGSLNTLNLSGVRLTNTSLRTIGRYCTMLKNVSFESCFCDGNVEKGLGILFSKCKNIEYLNLAENFKLEGECFGVIPVCTAYLNLAGCYNIPVENLDLLFSRLNENLKTLVLESFENAGIDNMNSWFRLLTKLKRLELSNWFISHDEQQNLDFSFLKDLEVLKLTNNFLVSTNALSSLRHCKKLRAVDLSYGMGMQDEIFPVLRDFKNLEACSFDGWINVDENIIQFIKEMGLKSVSLGDCMAITAETIIRIVTECESLRRISLRKLTDEQEETLSPESFETPEINARMESNRCEINIKRNGTNLCIWPVPDKDYFAVRQNPKEFYMELSQN